MLLETKLFFPLVFASSMLQLYIMFVLYVINSVDYMIINIDDIDN